MTEEQDHAADVATPADSQQIARSSKHSGGDGFLGAMAFWKATAKAKAMIAAGSTVGSDDVPAPKANATAKPAVIGP